MTYFLIYVFSESWGNNVNTDIFTVKELSEYLKLNEKTAYRLAAKGEIPGFKVGGSWRFRKSEIDTWIEEQAKCKK
tara:strand:- start:560 stop:787 length:228 start_codon:yes stop_codon:yes gene_type:complete